MIEQPLMTLTYLPTAEDQRRFMLLEQRTLARPGLFEQARLRRLAQYAVFALLLGSAALYFLASGVWKELGLLCFCLLLFFSTVCGPYPHTLSGKRRLELMQSKGRSSSRNVFIYEDRLELRSVYEECSYPWTLLTEWHTDGDFILCFDNDNVRRLPARAMNEAQRAELERLLRRRTGMNEGE